MTGCPLSWPISYAACESCAPLLTMSVEDKAMFEEMAADYLWNWTLKTFGVCSGTIRPCRSSLGRWGSAFWGHGRGLHPELVAGEWLNLGCGVCRDTCSCGVPTSLRLPGPIVSMSQVFVDGAVLPATSYRVDNESLLVRTDGAMWPWCQNLALPTTEPGTWSITYDYGREVPIGGQIAAGVLACELAKAACRDASCALPQRVQTITRQGVTLAMLDPFDGIEAGRTGIWLIDSWVASIVKPIRPGRVYSPDVPRPKWRREHA